VCAAIVTSERGVGAHAIVPDGVATEWLTREAASADSALIVRDRDEPGELVWRDRAGDARGPDDVTQLRAHGNPDGIGFILRFAAAPSPCAQLQIAVDLDRAPSSGARTFSADSATNLRVDARPELILVATAAGGVALDPSGAVRARFGAGAGADGLELFVPWSALGLATWPAGMRITPALFCAPDRVTPVAPMDRLSSAVIDALSDYGGPSPLARSTRDEVTDGAIDHVFALSFGTSGSIIQPLSVQRLAPLADPARGGPWIELRNRSAERVSLDGYALGDEAVPGGPDGLVALPPGLSLASGDTVVIAQDGAAYRRVYGAGADVELGATDPATPDALPLPSRGTGSLSWAATGDEVALFDAERTLLDVVTYNAGAYPGVRSHMGLASNAAITRSPLGLDTDDCQLDFYFAGAVCGRTEECPDTQCAQCESRVCAERPDGLDCAFAGCVAGRCFAGACVERADAGGCSVMDASVPADASAEAGERDGSADVMDALATIDGEAPPNDARAHDSAQVTDASREDRAQVTDASREDRAQVTDASREDIDATLADATPPDAGGTVGRGPSCGCRAPGAGAASARASAILLAIAWLSARRARRN
jgi:hypothetical protein